MLNDKGRKIIGWDEILEGGLAPNATVMSWRGIEGAIAAAKEGHDAIMTPNSHLYFDYYQTTDIENVPLSIGGYIPLQKVYGFEPVPSNLSENEAKHIIGVQANLWTEYIPSTQQVEYMIMPRIDALRKCSGRCPTRKITILF
jgi:N-acetyl-beta-hexosaminidase